ncbi:MAG: hypothetical protein ACD_12C00095G0005, partial [uncultured bacterium]
MVSNKNKKQFPKQKNSLINIAKRSFKKLSQNYSAILKRQPMLRWSLISGLFFV